MKSATGVPSFFSKSEYEDFWELRLGSDSALKKWRGTFALLLSWLLMFVWIPCLIAGYHDHVHVAAAIGLIAVTGTVIFGVYGQVLLTASNRLASENLGIKIGGRHGTYPPTSEKLLAAWRTGHGLEMSGPESDDD